MPYLACNSCSWRISEGSLELSNGAFPSSSKNFSNPPGRHIRISLPSDVLVFAQRCRASRGAQMLAPTGK